MKTAKNAPKARKISTAELNARAAANLAALDAMKAKSAAKAEGAAPTLTPQQTTAVDSMILAANAVEGSTRKAAMAIHAVYALGIHAAHGLALGQYVTRTLIGAGIAKATAYYLKDAGEAYATLGEARANLFPMEGLRALASASKGDRSKLQAMATDAQSGDESIRPSLENCRKAAKGTGSGLDRDGMVKALASKAMKYGEQDHDSAMALLEAAMDRIAALKAKADVADDADD